MKFGFKQIILSTAFAGIAVPAFAQSADNPFNRGRYTAVTDRRQADFDPEAVRAGSFDVWANLGLSAAYNDNILAEAENPDDDTVIHIRPEVEARSDWTSHALTAGVTVDHKEYVANDEETSTDYDAYLDGRFDVRRSFALTGRINAGHTTEERYEPGNVLSEPAQYDLLGGSVGAVFRTDRIQLQVNGSTTERNFNTEYDFRDYTENALFARASYAVSPDLALFVQGEQAEQDYDFAGNAINPNRDGTRTTVQVGASFEFQAPFRGEIAIGNVEEDKDDPAWADTDGLSVDGRVYWFPTQITTVTFSANQGVFDPGLLEVASADRANYGVRVDHELRRNIIIFGDVSFGKYDYEGTDTDPYDREDKYSDIQVGLAYKINKRMHADVSYRFHNQESEGTNRDQLRESVDQNIFAVGLKFYP